MQEEGVSIECESRGNDEIVQIKCKAKNKVDVLKLEPGDACCTGC